jgi:hypothetical protein
MALCGMNSKTIEGRIDLKIRFMIGGIFCLALGACANVERAATDLALGGGGAGVGYALGGAKGAGIGGGVGLLFGEGFNYLNNKKVNDAKESGYVLGRSDETKNLYWAQRNVVKSDLGLKRKLVEVTVPAHYDSDGVFIEASRQTVEVVE